MCIGEIRTVKEEAEEVDENAHLKLFNEHVNFV